MRGTIDDVIMPHATRKRIASKLRVGKGAERAMPTRAFLVGATGTSPVATAMNGPAPSRLGRTAERLRLTGEDVRLCLPHCNLHKRSARTAAPASAFSRDSC
jgi:hypothetical protein